MFVDLSLLQIAFLFPTFLFSLLFLHYGDTQILCICILMAFNMSLLLSVCLYFYCSLFSLILWDLLIGIQQHSPCLGGDPKLIHHHWRKWWWFDKGLEGTYCCSKENCRFTSGTSRSKGDIVDILMNSSIFFEVLHISWNYPTWCGALNLANALPDCVNVYHFDCLVWPNIQMTYSFRQGMDSISFKLIRELPKLGFKLVIVART